MNSAARLTKICLCMVLCLAAAARAQTPAQPAATQQTPQSPAATSPQQAEPQSPVAVPPGAGASGQTHIKWNTPVTAEAIWHPPANFLENMHKACDADDKHFSSCFIGEMRKSGASPQAVAFTERTDFQGIVEDFRKAGPLDIAYTMYVFRANENQVWFLVNGSPPMFDVDDPSYFPKTGENGLDENPDYQRIKQKYPNVIMFPGDRSPQDGPEVMPMRGGGVRFLVNYWLTDQCHACARVGSVRVAFGFDPQGRFLGARVVSVSPVPVQGEKP